MIHSVVLFFFVVVSFGGIVSAQSRATIDSLVQSAFARFQKKSVDKDILLQTERGDLYKTALARIQENQATRVVGGMALTRQYLNELFSGTCRLNDQDIGIILYQNRDIREQFSQIAGLYTPTSIHFDRFAQACERVIACKYPSLTESQRQQEVYYSECIRDVTLAFVMQESSIGMQNNMSAGIMGQNIFVDGDPDNGAYDLLVDIAAIDKIMFGQHDEPPVAPFFEMPTVKSSNSATKKKQLSSPMQSSLSPLYAPLPQKSPVDSGLMDSPGGVSVSPFSDDNDRFSPLDNLASLVNAQNQQSPQNIPSSRYTPLQFANQCLEQINTMLEDKSDLPTLEAWETYLDHLRKQWDSLLALGQLPFDPSLQSSLVAWGDEEDHGDNGSARNGTYDLTQDGEKKVPDCKEQCRLGGYEQASAVCAQRVSINKQALRECNQYARLQSGFAIVCRAIEEERQNAVSLCNQMRQQFPDAPDICGVITIREHIAKQLCSQIEARKPNLTSLCSSLGSQNLPQSRQLCRMVSSQPNPVKQELCEANCCRKDCNANFRGIDRLICISQCLCGEVSGPSNQQLGDSIFSPQFSYKVRFCRIPVVITPAMRRLKSVMSVQEIVNEILSVLVERKESGKIIKHMKTREMFETAVQENNFFDTIGITFFVKIKPIFAPVMGPQAQQKQEEEFRQLSNTMRGFAGSLESRRERNKYLVGHNPHSYDKAFDVANDLADMMRNQEQARTMETQRRSANAVLLMQANSNSMRAAVSDEVVTFIDTNAQFWQEMVEMTHSLRQTSRDFFGKVKKASK